MNEHIASHRGGFAVGLTQIVASDAADNLSRIGLAVLRLRAGETYEVQVGAETAWLLMSGAVRGRAGDVAFEFKRRSLFDESASCVHVCAGTPRDHRSRRRQRADRVWLRESTPVRGARVHAIAGAERSARPRAGRRARAALRAHHLRSQQLARRSRTGAGRSGDVSRRLVELSAASPSAARDLSLSLHEAAGLRPCRARRCGGESARVRHHQDSRRARSRAMRRARLRHVLLVGDPSPAGQAVHGSRVHAGTRLDDAAGRVFLAAPEKVE